MVQVRLNNNPPVKADCRKEGSLQHITKSLPKAVPIPPDAKAVMLGHCYETLCLKKSLGRERCILLMQHVLILMNTSDE